MSLSILGAEWSTAGGWGGCVDAKLVISVSSNDAVTIRILDKDRPTEGTSPWRFEIPISEIGDRKSMTVTAMHKVGGRTRSEEVPVPVHINRSMNLEPVAASGRDTVHVSATFREGYSSEKSVQYALSSTELTARFKGCALKNPRVDVGKVELVDGELVHRIDPRELLKQRGKTSIPLKAKLEVQGGTNSTAVVTLDDKIDLDRMLHAMYAPTRDGNALPWAAAPGPDSAILAFLGDAEIVRSGDIAFVAWRDTTKETPAGACQYQDASGVPVSLMRMRVDQRVKVVEARTGKTRIERTFPGSSVPCPKTVWSTTDATTNAELNGSVPFDIMRTWLASLDLR